VNNIADLVELIASNGGAATLEEICKLYSKKHKMIIFNNHKAAILVTLKSHLNEVFFDEVSNKWILSKNANKNYLFVSDNVVFPTIRKAMLQLFGKSVPSQGGYFKVDETYDAWFPQPGDGKWSNVLSEDGQYWNETPSDKGNNTEPNGKLRYSFIKVNNGYRFTGVFKYIGRSNGSTRVYKLVDDKIEIKFIIVTQDEETEKERFRNWLANQVDKDGNPVSKPNTIAIYVRTIKKISDKLIVEGRISESLYLSDDISLLKNLYDEMLNGSGELHKINENGNRTWSSAIKKLIDMREEQLGVKTEARFFFRPTVISTWNYFKEKGSVGDFETFSATQDMMVGDFLLIYVGKKDNEKEAGIYSLATIVESPFINKNENDVSFGKLAVKAKYVVVSNEVIINYEKTIEIAKQLQSAHKIDDKYSEFIKKSFGI
jgi:hypothetical protein